MNAEDLVRLLDEAFDRRAWHGTNLRGSVRGLTEAEASCRPAAGRHNIWEEVVHATYWKYAVRRRLIGAKRGSFGEPGSNWFVRPAPKGGSDWGRDMARLVEEHRMLRAAVAGADAALLRKCPAGKNYTNAEMILGAACHDVYHAGQIQLLKRLQR
jgi:DinB superfamily